jgi:hypothetical protein
MGRHRSGIHRWALALAVAFGTSLAAAGGVSSITSAAMREWLTYIASDDLQGREVFSTGIGLAAAYITNHLETWGVKPAGSPGAPASYLQTVRVLGIKTVSHSAITVEVGGEKRTFVDGSGITFAKNVGGKRQFTVSRVEFSGYGLDAPAAGHMDFRGKTVKDAVVVWLGASGPNGIDQSAYRRLLAGRNRYATEILGAAGAIGPARGGFGGRSRPETSGQAGPGADAPGGAAGGPAGGGGVAQAGRQGGRQGGGRGGSVPAADFTTVQRLDAPLPPGVTAGDEFFEFLFHDAPVKYEELKQKADAQSELPSFRLEGVRITFNLDADYEVVRTQLAHNVVGVVEGSDSRLKSAYVAFGAHYDHVGYAEGEVVSIDGSTRRDGAKGRVTPGHESDRIWNGADDDGSGTVAVMALARAFAQAPRPKRSLLFVWHVGEERGLWGSRYFADHPTVPLDRIVAQLNIDMVGRNRDDRPSESNTVYLVGSDRISSELHEINRAANAGLSRSLTLDYEFNDPADPDQLYTRSDHYSYASKGIPVIFFTTGLHADYHANTDEVGKIEFDKLTRITQMIFETGLRLANLDHEPVRDNLGPRAGRNTR